MDENTEGEGRGGRGGEKRGWLLRDRPLIIHGALSTPIEGENRSYESESGRHSPPPSTPPAPLWDPRRPLFAGVASDR